MRARRRIAFTMGASAITLLAAACGGGTHSADKAAPGKSASSAPAQPVAMETETRTATWTDSHNQPHHLRIMPKRLARGSASDLANVHMLGEDVTRMVPYYLTISYTNTDQDTLQSPSPESDLSVIGVDGQPGKAISVSPDVLSTDPSWPGGCGKGGPDRLEAGGTAEVCRIFLFPQGRQPATVSYTDGDDGTPLIWQITGAKDDATTGVLPAGRPANYVWQDSDNHTVPIRVTPKSVRAGSVADLGQYNLSADQKRLVPYYVTIEYRNIGKSELYPDMHEGVVLRSASGKEVSALTLLNLNFDGSGNGIEQCPAPVQHHMLQPQGTFTQCTIHMMPKGDAPATLVFTSQVTGAQPVTWRAADGTR